MGYQYEARDQFMQELLALRGSHVELSKANEKLQMENGRLRGWERMYHQLMEDMRGIIYTTDATGVITYVSPSVQKFNGYEPRELIGRSLTELYQEDLPIAMEELGAESDKKRSDEKLENALNNKNQFYQLVGQSDQMREVYDLIDTVAESTAKVLVQGETGTGKDLVAHAIHQRSPRSEKPFVKVNCAAIPENLIESEMFGHVKGAFTGAISDKAGMFEVANGGTIFLDDIDTFPLHLQAKLLRVLEEQQFEHLGSTKTIQVDVRVIAASNQDLRKLMNEGRFRPDLFFRLNVIPMKIPPLRERPEDIILLANHFLEKYSALNKKQLEGFTDGAIRMLEEYPWPGNVRELENAIERAVILEEGSFINTQSLMISQDQKKPEFNLPNTYSNSILVKVKEQNEREKIIDALIENNWRRQKTADKLGINRVTLYNKMKKYEIKEEGEIYFEC
jgi:PAS domain S-box-containing protein